MPDVADAVKDAANLQNIVAELRKQGCLVPIVADIHFKPEAAMEAVKWVEVVRVNPGNYADSKKFAIKEYNDEQYAAELARWRSRFDVQVEVTVDRSTSEWRGGVGVVTRLIARAAMDPSCTTAFVCGPEVMMRFAVSELNARHVPAEDIYVSLERSMKCGVGLCGHCQMGAEFLCRDGPVFAFSHVARMLSMREV